MEFCGWVPFSLGTLEPKWSAVMDHAVPAIAASTPAEVHSWARANIGYSREAKDHWASPEDTVARGQGDCEDWAILERALLIAAGFPSDQLWMIVATDMIVREDHAFLIAGDVALDCRADDPIPLDRLSDYKPIFGFCGGKQYLFGRRKS